MWFNPLMTWLLKSPFHSMVSKNMLLVSVTGRKSGKSITTPTNYVRDGNVLWVLSWRDRTWWRNLRGGAKLQVLLARKNLTVTGNVIEAKDAVTGQLVEYYTKVPQYARYSGIALDAAGKPSLSDCERAAEKMVIVRIELP